MPEWRVDMKMPKQRRTWGWVCSLPGREALGSIPSNGVVVHTYNPLLRKERREDQGLRQSLTTYKELKINLGYKNPPQKDQV